MKRIFSLAAAVLLWTAAAQAQPADHWKTDIVNMMKVKVDGIQVLNGYRDSACSSEEQHPEKTGCTKAYAAVLDRRAAERDKVGEMQKAEKELKGAEREARLKALAAAHDQLNGKSDILQRAVQEVFPPAFQVTSTGSFRN